MKIETLAALLGLVLVAAVATCWSVEADADIYGTTATATWTPASGPVAGYEVAISRTTTGACGSWATELDVPGTTAAVSGNVGDTLCVRVRGYSAGKVAYGPWSPASDPVRLLAVPTIGPAGKPSVTLRCTDPALPRVVVDPATGDASCQP